MNVPTRWYDDGATIQRATLLSFLIENFPDHWIADTTSYSSVRGYYIPLSLSSDYVGSFVERSNCKELLEEIPFLSELSWGYGGSAAGVYLPFDEPGTEPVDATDALRLFELLEGLESYPVVNEDGWSELEWEAISEAWGEAWDDVDRYIDDQWEKVTGDYPPRDMELDVDAMIAHYREAEKWEDWDLRDSLTSVEGTQVYVDPDAIAKIIVEWCVEDDPTAFLKVAGFLDAASPFYRTPSAHGSRVAYFNSQIEELRTESLRVGSTFDTFL